MKKNSNLVHLESLQIGNANKVQIKKKLKNMLKYAGKIPKSFHTYKTWTKNNGRIHSLYRTNPNKLD